MKHTWILLGRQLCLCRIQKLVLCEPSSLWHLNKNTKPLYLHNTLIFTVLLHPQNTMPGRKMYTIPVFQVEKSKAQNRYVVCLRSRRKWKNWDLKESLWTPNFRVLFTPTKPCHKDSKSSSVKRHTSHCRRLMTMSSPRMKYSLHRKVIAIDFTNKFQDDSGSQRTGSDP